MLRTTLKVICKYTRKSLEMTKLPLCYEFPKIRFWILKLFFPFFKEFSSSSYSLFLSPPLHNSNHHYPRTTFTLTAATTTTTVYLSPPPVVVQPTLPIPFLCVGQVNSLSFLFLATDRQASPFAPLPLMVQSTHFGLKRELNMGV